MSPNDSQAASGWWTQVCNRVYVCMPKRQAWEAWSGKRSDGLVKAAGRWEHCSIEKLWTAKLQPPRLWDLPNSISHLITTCCLTADSTPPTPPLPPLPLSARVLLWPFLSHIFTFKSNLIDFILYLDLPSLLKVNPKPFQMW